MLASDDSLAVMRLLSLPGVGPAKVNAVIDWCKQSGRSPAELWDQPELLKTRLTADQFSRFVADKGTPALAQSLKDEDVRLLSAADVDYPQVLRETLKGKAPPLIYCRGNIELLSAAAVGFCGSRKASQKGLETAHDCADQLARHGLNIVSGYAAGVDTTAHIAALAAGGTTSIVLPEGILQFRLKKEFQQVWDWNRAIVISQFEPTSPWSVHNAMARNAVICALSRAVILIEAGTIGGSIAAGRTSLELGVPLFAPVYEGMPESAAGNRLLLEEGALPLGRSKQSNRAAIERVLEAVQKGGSSELQMSLFA